MPRVFYQELASFHVLNQLNADGLAFVSCLNDVVARDKSIERIVDTITVVNGDPDFHTIEWFIATHRPWLEQPDHIVVATRNYVENTFTLAVGIQNG